MTVSKCEFMPPRSESSVAAFLLTLDGVLTVEGSINYFSPGLGQDWRYSIVLEGGFFQDDYTERCVRGEVLDRYAEFIKGEIKNY